MKRSKIILILAAFLILALGPATHAQTNTGKIPITTSSPEARDLYLKGRDLAEKLRITDSLQYLEKAVQKDPNFALAHLNLAFSQPNAKGFFDSLNKAVALSPKASQGERLWIQGVEAGANGDPMRQRVSFRRLVADYPQDERAHQILGGHYFGLQEYASAVQSFEKAITINPNFSQPYNLVGYAYRFMEQYGKAEKAFQKYIELIPDDPNPYDSYAELLMRMGRYDESIRNYEKALAIVSNFTPSHIGIATNYNYKGEHEKARKQLQKLMGTAGNDGERRQAHFALSVSYIDEGSYQQGLAEQEKGLALARKINDAAAIGGDLTNIGNIHIELDQADVAKQKFEQALQAVMNSNLSAQVKDQAKRAHLVNMAQVALKKNDFNTARLNADMYKKQAEAIQNRFQIWQAHELIGTIALQEKQYGRAIAELQKSNQFNVYNIYRMAQAYEGLGDAKKASEMRSRVSDFNSLNDLNYAFVRMKVKGQSANVAQAKSSKGRR